ncbi:MAG TPA: NIL domain-containing protein [bacterium]|nr:NIL domain-containing protein [bacterium]
MENKKLVLKFPKTNVGQPIIWRLVKDYNLKFNIMKATITPEDAGVMVLELEGEKEDLKKGMEYLKKEKVALTPLSKDVRRNEEKCTHCGHCIVICPTQALYRDRKTEEIIFDSSRCIACELCVPACPPRAMEVHF